MRIADALRPRGDAVEIQELAARLLGEHLGAHRVAYAEIIGDHVLVERDYTAGLPSIVGRFPYWQFGEHVIGALRAGVSVVIDDVAAEPKLDEPERASFMAMGIRAVLAVSLVKEGRWVAAFGVHSIAPRHWTPEDLALVEDTAERTWAAVERARAEAALRETQARLQLALDAASMGTFVWHAAEARSEPDERTLRLFDLSPDEPGDLSAAFAARIHPDDRERHASAVIAAMELDGPRTLRQDIRVIHRDGSVHWLCVNARALFDGGAVIRIAGTVTDIGERKLIEDALREREEKLREGDRRKDEWIATLAHELRNPLAPLRIGLEVLRLLPDPPADATAMYGIMQHQLAHITRLVNDLLDVSRISRGKIELQRAPASLAEIVQIALDANRTAIAERELELSIRVDEALVLDVDAARMVQVFSNLLHNAAKFTPPRGRIEVVARRSGDEVVVAVSDTGTGISAELLPHIFELFTQGPRAQGFQGGLGIGLALARQLVELHGGRIAARSSGPGRGSELTVRLPLALDAARAPAIADPSAPQELVRTILIIEDNRDVAAALAMFVEVLGGAPQVAYDGESGLERLAELRPGTVLLDLGLPGLDGYDTCRRIRRQLGGEVQIIAVSGWGSAQDKQRAAEAGFDAHLTKPPDPAELRRYLFARAPGDGS